MLEILKFVRAALDDSGYNRAFSHFKIRGGRISATNGQLAVQTPIPIDIDCCPHGESFIKAVAACDDVISFHLEGGSLVVRSGKFKSHVPTCDPDLFPDYYPTGERFPIGQEIMPILRKLLPFVATDDRRPWACGIQFVNNSAIATNSICVVEAWLPVAFPVIANLPRAAVAELVRLKIEPEGLQVSPEAVTFHLPGGAWVSSRVMTYEWPDVGKIFEQGAQYSGGYMSGEQLASILDDVSKLEKFTDDFNSVHFHKEGISTSREDDPGTSIANPSAPKQGVFRADQLSALKGVIDRIGFGAYPAPIPFFGGDNLRGVMVGFNPQV